MTALTLSFASSKNYNPVLGKVIYCGVIKRIIELDYCGAFSVVLFECDWFQVEIDDYSLTRVNFKKLISKDDSYVLASQVHQVFYIQDGLEEDWHYVSRKLPRDCFMLKGNLETYMKTKVLEPDDDINLALVNDEDISWCRGDAFDRVQVQQINISSDLSVDTFDDDSDVDETEWDWMEPLT